MNYLSFSVCKLRKVKKKNMNRKISSHSGRENEYFSVWELRKVQKTNNRQIFHSERQNSFSSWRMRKVQKIYKQQEHFLTVEERKNRLSSELR